MTRCIVMLKHPSACSAWLHTCHLYPESFKDFPKNRFIDSLSWSRQFFVDDPPTVKKQQMSINFILDLLIFAFLAQEEFPVCQP